MSLEALQTAKITKKKHCREISMILNKKHIDLLFGSCDRTFFVEAFT